MHYPVAEPRNALWPGDRVLVPGGVEVVAVHAGQPRPNPGHARGTVTATLGVMGELSVVLDRPSPEGVGLVFADANELRRLEPGRGA